MDKKIPQHIGIIIDGNRRWARAQKLATFYGHQRGFDKLKDVATYTFEKGVKILTVYAFSTENWKRSPEEVDYLLGLFRKLLIEEVDFLVKEDVKVNILGRIQDFPKDLQEGAKNIKHKTKNGKKGILNICLSYSGREELVMAVKNIIKDNIAVEKIDTKLISRYLYTKNLPDPDLIIRTSGEQRLSGFLTWQSVYSELLFIKKAWPDFSKKDLDYALKEYSQRQRRFGGN